MSDKLCNMCGLTTKLKHQGTLDHNQFYGLINATVEGGYESTPGNGEGALDDTSTYTFSLCEFCLDHIFKNAVIPPIVDNGQEKEDFRPAAQRVEEDHWRNYPEPFLTESTKRDEARKHPYIYPKTSKNILSYRLMLSKLSEGNYRPHTQEMKDNKVNLVQNIKELYADMSDTDKEVVHYNSTFDQLDSCIPTEVYSKEDIAAYEGYFDFKDEVRCMEGNEEVSMLEREDFETRLDEMYKSLSPGSKKLVDDVDKFLGEKFDVLDFEKVSITEEDLTLQKAQEAYEKSLEEGYWTYEQYMGWEGYPSDEQEPRTLDEYILQTNFDTEKFIENK